MIVRQAKFGIFAEDYAQYRAGFTDEFFNRLKPHLTHLSKSSILDVGTGTGTLARWFAGQSSDVIGLDFDAEMIESAKRLDRNLDVEVRYVTSSADYTPFQDKRFDFIIAGQCWHWFSHEDVFVEMKRIMRDQGRIIIAYFDWIGEKGNPVDLMYQIKQNHIEDDEDHQKKWPLGFYPQDPNDLVFPGFNLIAHDLWREQVIYTHKSWRGRLRAYSGLGGRLDIETLERFESEYGEKLRDRFPDETFFVPHKVWFGIWG